MNRFFLTLIFILAAASNLNAKNCKKGIPCGNTCISRDKVCGGKPSDSLSSRSSESGSSSSSSSSNSPSQNSSESNSSYTSYPSPQKNQGNYEGNGIIVTNSELKKDNSAQSADWNDDKDVATEDSDEKKTNHAPKTTTAVVANILDADIFQFSGKKKQKFRLYGIDAPEDGQPFYQEAKDILKKFTHKKKITAKIYSQDSDETALAVVFANGKNINELMVKSGHAWVRRDLCDEAFCDNWIESEEEAKSQGKGLWSDSGRIPPWVWK